MSYNGDKRRRVDDFNLYVAPSTSRTAAKARNDRAAQEQAQRQASTRPKTEDITAPLLDLASLPPVSLQRYLSRYGLLEPHGSLSYHHAVFPVPPLAANLQPPLTGRVLNSSRSSRPSSSAHYHAHAPPTATPHSNSNPNPAASATDLATTAAEQAATLEAVANGEQPAVVTVGRGRKRPWSEPKTAEFGHLSAYDDPQTVVHRLANKAKSHWDKRDSVKEGETLTNFIFALRMRSHTLRATPPG